MTSTELMNARAETKRLYVEAADTFAFHAAQMEKAKEASKTPRPLDAPRASKNELREQRASREYYAQCYGRRQAIGSVLKEVFGVPESELQETVDAINEKYGI